VHSGISAAVLCIPLAAIAAQVGIAQVPAHAESAKATPHSAPYGIITTFAGTGWAGYDGDHGPANQAQLDTPEGVAVDSKGNIYVADTVNNRIRRIEATTGEITTFAGNQEAGYAGDKGPADQALLYCPRAVSLNAKNNLYIADSCNDVIRRVDGVTRIITTVAGHPYVTEYDRYCMSGGDEGPATTAQLCNPSGVAIDGTGNIYIADTANSLIRKVAAGTGLITTVAGTRYGGLQGTASEGSPATNVFLDNPYGVIVDAERNFYFSDEYNCLVRKVTVKTGIITTIAGLLTKSNTDCTDATDGVPATETGLSDPTGIAFDSAGNLFIADEFMRLVRRVDAKTGVISTVAGDLVYVGLGLQGPFYYGALGYTGDGGAATVAQLSYPRGLALDKSDSLYIADTGNSAIRKVTGTLGARTVAPKITPEATGYGLGFASSVQVTLDPVESGGKVYYTTDGTTPTTASRTYTGPITLSKSRSVIAFATSPGAANSNAVQGNYFQIPAPVISPNGGAFTKPQSVIVTLPQLEGLFIDYTTDGSDPCTSPTALGSLPIILGSSLTLKAVGNIGGGCGPVTTAKFTIPTAPVVSTSNAINITATSATLNGTVNPGGLATKYWFAYGEICNAPDKKTPEVALAADNAMQKVSAKIAGLAGGTFYCFTLMASNRAGQTSGYVNSLVTK
jgi:sugar lactone lactonase YvrE